MFVWGIRLGLFGLWASFAACGSSSGSSADCPATNAVSLVDYAFSPACITVTAGSSVTFTNTTDTTHTTTSDAGAAETFDSGNMAQNATFVHQFATVGNITGHCSYHSQMTFEVVVK